MVLLDSTSKTLTKLSMEAEAAILPEGWAATETTPRQWPELVRTRVRSPSEFQRRTVSSREPVRRSAGDWSVAGAHVAAQIESECALSRVLSHASFIFFWLILILMRADGWMVMLGFNNWW